VLWPERLAPLGGFKAQPKMKINWLKLLWNEVKSLHILGIRLEIPGVNEQ